MDVDTAKTLNWQLSQRLSLDPSVPHTINAETDCDCYSPSTRNDALRIWVESDEGHNGVEGYWHYLTDFIASLVREGQPTTLVGVAEATISPHADQSTEDGCQIVNLQEG